MAIYLDSSAIVKLVVKEAESNSLRRFLRDHPTRVSSALARVEVVRAVRTQGTEAQHRANEILGRVRLLRIDDEVLTAASLLAPGILRSLDAIHLASAAAFGAELEGLVTYDLRMAEAARLVGIAIFAPSARG